MKRGRFFVHIGLAKTGTTAIQEALYANVSWFASHGVVVPRLGLNRNNGHHGLVCRLTDPDPDAENEAVDQLCDELVAAGGRDVVVSSEQFSTPLPRIGIALEHLRTIADRVDLDLRVLLWLRQPIDLAESHLLQSVKMADCGADTIVGLSAPAVDLTPHAWRMLHARAGRPVWILARYRHWCRPHELDVRCYSPQDDVLADFVSAVGVALDEDFRRPRFRSNPSLTFDAVAAMANAPIATDHAAHRRRVDSMLGLGSEGGRSRFLHPSTRAVLERESMPWCRWVIARHPSCEGLVVPGDRADTALDTDRRQAADRYVREVSAFPTLLSEDQPRGHELFERLDLSDGWRRSEGGATTTALVARIRCRLHEAHLGAYGSKVWIRLDSEPHQAIPTLRCMVNGVAAELTRDTQAHANTALIDRATLGRRQTLDIELSTRTSGPTGPSAWTLRGLAWDVMDEPVPDSSERRSTVAT